MNASKQSAAPRVTPSQKKVAVKAPALRDVKDTKVSKMLKPAVLKHAQMMPYKGPSKIAQYSYNKVSSTRVADAKPLKQPGVGKLAVDLTGSKP